MTVKIHKRDGISCVRNSELTEEDQKLFGLFNLAAACPHFPEEGRQSYANDYERYLEHKEFYIKRYKGTDEFRVALQSYSGYVPYAV